MWPFPVGDNVASGAVSQVRAICEHGQPRPVRPYGFLFGGRLLFYHDGCLEGRVCHQKDRFFLSVPASEESLRPVSECAIRSGELSCLVPLRKAGEPEGEATQAVAQLGVRIPC